jgi:hypothetical protein
MALRLFWIAIAAIILIGFWTMPPERTSSPTRSDPAPAPAPPRLHLLSFDCAVEHGYTYVRGEVKNLSSTPIEDLRIIGELRQADGTLVKTATAMVEYDPLMPGQSSPFEALTPHNPLATKCQPAFKTFWGPQIPYTYDKAK